MFWVERFLSSLILLSEMLFIVIKLNFCFNNFSKRYLLLLKIQNPISNIILFLLQFLVCSVLEAPDNGTLNCTGSPDTGFNCTIACNSGFSFDRGVKPYYECGPTTLFLWDFNSDDNPNGDLPTCNRMLILKEVYS